MIIVCVVWYCAKLGKKGLDLDDMMQREEVFSLTWDLLEPKQIDELGPYHPEETDGYVVVKVTQGEHYCTMEVYLSIDSYCRRQGFIDMQC